MDESGADLLSRFAAFPASLEAPASVAGPPPAGEWGAAEITRHLIAVEDEVWRARFASIEQQDEPRWAWTEPGQAPGFDHAPLSELLAAFADARAGTVEIVTDLDESGWARAGIHTTYGRLDVAGLLRLAIDHDQEHLMGIPAPDRPLSGGD